MKKKAEKFLNTALGGNMNIATLKPLALIEIMTAFAEIEVAAITVIPCCKSDSEQFSFADMRDAFDYASVSSQRRDGFAFKEWMSKR